MASILSFKGIKSFFGKLKRLADTARKEAAPKVIVGYTAAYAIYVHENLEMKLKGKPRPKKRGKYWDPQGRAQAKFLEQPANELQPELGRIIETAMRNGATMPQALLMAGLRLQRESQQLVPVDTGNLKASAFTRKE